MKVCRHARTWIERSFAGSLGLKDQFLLEEHVIECEACRERWEESHSLLAALDRLPAAPEDQVDLERSLEAINAGINAGVGAMPASVAIGRRTLWISAAAALLLVLGSALW